MAVRNVQRTMVTSLALTLAISWVSPRLVAAGTAGYESWPSTSCGGPAPASGHTCTTGDTDAKKWGVGATSQWVQFSHSTWDTDPSNLEQNGPLVIALKPTLSFCHASASLKDASSPTSLLQVCQLCASLS